MRKILALIGTIVMILTLVGCDTAPQHILTYERGELTITEINGEDVPSIYIYTEYTNDSGETALPADWVSVKVFQHGIEQPVFVMTGDKVGEYVQCDTGIQTGTTAKVVWTFYREDESEVTVELSDGTSYIIGGQS